MKNKILAIGCLLAVSLSSTFAQGVLTPPGAPAPTMKTLDQIESRIPISALPYTISTPGSYYVITNLLVGVNDGIVITANNVTLDLNGFTISSVQNPPTFGKAIALGSGSGPVANITIRNGCITSGVTNNGTTFGGNGFAYGIFQFGGQPAVNVHVSDVTVSGCLYVGIHLGGSNTVVESCCVNTAGSYGIYAQTISGSTAVNCGSYGIYATGSANNCSGTGIINGSGLIAGTAHNCFGYSRSGTGLSAASAENCYGTSSTGTGLSATSAANCFGSSTSGAGLAASVAQNGYGTSSTGTGLYASSTAINCYGTSSTGTGISANIAQGCYGWSNGQSGFGIYATSTHNCFGNSSSSGIGIYATSIAIGCVGYSNSGTGIYAFIANSCNGQTSSGTGLSFTHNVNSF